MTSRIELNSEFKEFRNALSALADREMPFVIAKTLTDTAKSAQAEESRQLPRRLDRPTPFTKRAYGIKPATKTSPEAHLFAKPVQAQYLSMQETGGTATPPKRALIAPRSAKLNRYGNLPRGGLKRMKARK